MQVALSVSNREELLRSLDRNQVDLAIMGKPPEGGNFEAVAFAQHPFVVIASPSHPAARRRKVTLASLATERFIAREQGSHTRETMEETLRAARVRPELGLEASSNETIK